MSRLTNFYFGQGRDHAGRTLEQVLAMSYEELEETHDYIQWLFPLREMSMFNECAPILTNKDIADFRSKAALLTNLQRAFAVMLDFYGFMGGQGGVVIRRENWRERYAVWGGQYNHNNLRITRILKSLSILGMEEEAHGFRKAILELYNNRLVVDKANLVTLEYWSEALNAR